MFRIDVATAANTLPTPAAAGTPGYFTKGNPGGGIPATVLDQDFFNMVQEELVNVVVGTGGSLSKTDHSQVLNAILGLVAGATPPGIVDHYFGVTAPSGWLVRNGGTIGSAASSATSRANADTLPLYTVIWNTTNNIMDGGAFCIQTSAGSLTTRGVSAAADFAADKRLPLPNDLGLFDRGLNRTGSGPDSSRILATSQADDNKAHGHTVTKNVGNAGSSGSGSGPDFYVTNSSDTVTLTVGDAGGPESRPVNRAYLPIIKL